uniref:Uncharacterized protein n=1 Tax=Solanum tuberosum TaxID=4113 RepID=M1D787_SOLTU
MSISNELQMFSVCECSCCKQKKCTKDKKDFEYPKCNRKTTRLFEIDLIDGTALATTSISGVLGEKLFFVTAENIFDITCIKVTFYLHISLILCMFFLVATSTRLLLQHHLS